MRMAFASALATVMGVLALVSAWAVAGVAPGATDTSASPHVRIRRVGLGQVRWTKGFWGDRMRLLRTVTIPSMYKALRHEDNAAYLSNFKIAAGLMSGRRRGRDWGDGDCYKFLEALAYVYAVTRDPKLDALLDEWIAVVATCQQPDGYLSLNHARYASPHRHEMYNMGHLMTAACIHYRATGKTSFLAVAKKVGDHLVKTFHPTPPKLIHFGWNPSNIMGLIELYRTTGDKRYLELAGVFVGNRGTSPGGNAREGGTDQIQDRVPLRKETEAVGHGVTAMYLYCGAADLVAETDDRALLAALDRLWASACLRKMDITGAVGMGNVTSPRGDPCHEAFGADYDLPNEYNETCANIGNAMWNFRMLALTGEAKYADMIERVVHNALPAAIDLTGRKFFYCNPLVWQGQEGRRHHTGQRWFVHRCYCCPPSVARTLAKLGTWAYGLSADGVWVHLYGGNTLDTKLPDGAPVRLEQQTDYPRGGRIRLTVRGAPAKEMTLRLRIPAWAERADLRVNGKPTGAAARPGMYAALRRSWAKGDIVELNLPMPIRLMEAHPAARKLHNKVAVMRGPVVYCLECPKKTGGERMWREGVFLPENVTLTPRFRKDLLGGVLALEGKAVTFQGRDAFVKAIASAPPPAPAKPGEWLYRAFAPRTSLPAPREGLVPITLIPYYAWANRGLSFMEVWIPLARPKSAPGD